MDVIFESQQEIIKYIIKAHDNKKKIPDFIDSFLKYHLTNYHSEPILEIVYNILKSLFHKITSREH